MKYNLANFAGCWCWYEVTQLTLDTLHFVLSLISFITGHSFGCFCLFTLIKDMQIFQIQC